MIHPVLFRHLPGWTALHLAAAHGLEEAGKRWPRVFIACSAQQNLEGKFQVKLFAKRHSLKLQSQKKHFLMFSFNGSS